MDGQSFGGDSPGALELFACNNGIVPTSPDLCCTCGQPGAGALLDQVALELAQMR